MIIEELSFLLSKEVLRTASDYLQQAPLSFTTIVWLQTGNDRKSQKWTSYEKALSAHLPEA
jgi:hypothetical protein